MIRPFECARCGRRNYVDPVRTRRERCAGCGSVFEVPEPAPDEVSSVPEVKPSLWARFVVAFESSLLVHHVASAVVTGLVLSVLLHFLALLTLHGVILLSLGVFGLGCIVDPAGMLLRDRRHRHSLIRDLVAFARASPEERKERLLAVSSFLIATVVAVLIHLALRGFA